MPSWNQVLLELQSCKRVDALDYVRRKYLKQLADYTGRNTIAYYSGWLQKPKNGNTGINDDDKNGLMATIHGLDRDKGLDLILHTPGGDLAATESIVNYLRAMFATDIRAVVPQIAMSAGTMIACSCESIIMGKQSSIGPIDPQYGGIATQGVIEEFERAKREVKADPSTIPVWQAIVSKYHPTFLGECQNAIELSTLMVTDWLKTNMFKAKPEDQRNIITKKIIDKLNNHSDTKIHSRHIHYQQAKDMGLNIIQMEDDQKLQDLILTTHHAFMHVFASTNCLKIIENHEGNAVVHRDKE